LLRLGLLLRRRRDDDFLAFFLAFFFFGIGLPFLFRGGSPEAASSSS
jgi:hypothetical protein